MHGRDSDSTHEGLNFVPRFAEISQNDNENHTQGLLCWCQGQLLNIPCARILITRKRKTEQYAREHQSDEVADES